MLPLEGITIISIEQAVAAPFATRQLADLGARVVKIERPDVGDFARAYDETVRGMASHFVWLNRSNSQVITRLDRAQIANARMNSMQEFWDHPQLQARESWREVGSPVGPLKALLPPVTMRNVEPRMDPIPALGEQTEPILRSLGYQEEQIGQLRAERVI